MSPSVQTVRVGEFFDAGRESLQISLRAGCQAEALARSIPEPLAHRTGLALTGFFEHFASKRIQVIGLAEYAYLQSLTPEVRRERLDALFAHDVPCVVFTRGMEIFDEVRALADEKNVAVFVTQLETRYFIHSSAFVLEKLSSPRMDIHATMVEVSGLGVLLEGDPGIGKSETALGLLKRGHALVADDYTILRRNGENRLIASAKVLSQGFMEIRGIGFIHVQRVFGVCALRDEKQVDMVITFTRATPETNEKLERIGDGNNQRRVFLDIAIPQLIIPVAPGRDLVNIVETAVCFLKLKQSGYVAADELRERWGEMLERVQKEKGE
ncbi:MAG: HPr(Ser) kinase/phosphatase [Kiritimatiellae bacterium]|nr:HPr(Ser) kinase/phosphatase [Kiritimatiellia bacterium]